MADYLTKFIAYVKHQLVEEDGLSLEQVNQTVTWCLTVPAMWSDKSKGQMRKAANKAGLPDDALDIILEPEAAALHARETNAPPLTPGMTVCVLDVGGGTADITVHDVVSVGGKSVLAEAVCAAGAMCGSAYVDNAFRWIACKHNFTGLPGGQRSGPKPLEHRVPIPQHLLASIDPRTRQRLSQEQRRVSPDIILSADTMEKLFNGPVTQVVEAATRQLRRLNKQCSVVILVGGFAQSRYLRARVQSGLVATGLAAQLVVPPLPYAAVLSGAVIFGLNPHIIHARRSRVAYGLRGVDHFQPGAPAASRFWNTEEGVHESDARFQLILARDQLVSEDEVVSVYACPVYRSATSCYIDIYATDNNDLKWIDTSNADEHHKLATLLVWLSNPGGLRVIEIEFRAGRTELSVTARDVVRQERVNTTLTFASS